MTTLNETTLVTRYTERYGIPGEDIINTLRSTAFKQEGGVSPSDEEILNLLLVADSLKLDPFLGEIKAVFDITHGIIPVVSFEGWTKLANAQPDYDGIEITYSTEMLSPEGGKQGHVWIECAVYRKEKKHPVVVREYLDEVYVPAFKIQTANGLVLKPSAWQSHTKRQHRMKTIVQAYRTAFGFGGIYDPDEADRILSARNLLSTKAPENEISNSIDSEIPTEKTDPVELNASLKTQVSFGTKESKSLQRLKSRVEKENFSQQSINVALSYLKDRIKDPAVLTATTNEFTQWVKSKSSNESNSESDLSDPDVTVGVDDINTNTETQAAVEKTTTNNSLSSDENLLISAIVDEEEY